MPSRGLTQECLMAKKESNEMILSACFHDDGAHNFGSVMAINVFRYRIFAANTSILFQKGFSASKSKPQHFWNATREIIFIEISIIIR